MRWVRPKPAPCPGTGTGCCRPSYDDFHTTYRRLAVNWKNHFDRPLSANFIYILNYLVLIAKSGQNQIGRLGSIYSGSSTLTL